MSQIFIEFVCCSVQHRIHGNPRAVELQGSILEGKGDWSAVVGESSPKTLYLCDNTKPSKRSCQTVQTASPRYKKIRVSLLFLCITYKI